MELLNRVRDRLLEKRELKKRVEQLREELLSTVQALTQPGKEWFWKGDETTGNREELARMLILPAQPELRKPARITWHVYNEKGGTDAKSLWLGSKPLMITSSAFTEVAQVTGELATREDLEAAKKTINYAIDRRQPHTTNNL